VQEKLQKTKKISAKKKIYAKEVSSIKPASYTREIPSRIRKISKNKK